MKSGDRLVAVLEITPFGKGEARLMVTDPLPAGLEIDNPNLITGGSVSALDFLDLATDVAHSEFRQDRFLTAIDRNDNTPFRSGLHRSRRVAGHLPPTRRLGRGYVPPRLHRPYRCGHRHHLQVKARWFIVLAAGLTLAAYTRDRADLWIDATDLPNLTLQTSNEVLDRNGALLRAYTVADGRWRLAVDPRRCRPVLRETAAGL